MKTRTALCREVMEWMPIKRRLNKNENVSDKKN